MNAQTVDGIMGVSFAEGWSDYFRCPEVETMIAEANDKLKKSKAPPTKGLVG